MSNETQNDVRKELALKYFGQPLDEKHYSTTESLVQDQIKGEFKHEVRQFEKSYDNQQAEQISLMV